MSFGSIFRGLSGEMELGRTLGASGGASYIVSPLLFQAWDLHKGGHFDPAAFCAAYGGGFGLMIAGVGTAIALKDRNVAVAKQQQAMPPLNQQPEGQA